MRERAAHQVWPWTWRLWLLIGLHGRQGLALPAVYKSVAFHAKWEPVLQLVLVKRKMDISRSGIPHLARVNMAKRSHKGCAHGASVL